MAKNPPWTRDELILALDLYFRVDPSHASKTHPEVVALSEVLNGMPVHADRTEPELYRNPNGVYMKLCNFLRFDPSYAGVGLQRGGRLEEDVWAEFASDHSRLAKVASAIRSAVESGEARNPLDDEDEEASEGRILLRQHKRRERSRKLVSKKKAETLRATGRLACEACGFDFNETYGNVGQGFAECHHRAPLAELDVRRKTKLSDLAIVCSNCHRMLHRSRPMPSVEDLREVVIT